MSRTSSTIAISIATSLITSSLMFLGLQFWLVPHLKKSSPTNNKPVEVPKILGLRPDDAKIILKNKGLLISVTKSAPHPTIKMGLISNQNPLPGSLLKKGESVKVQLSTGIPKVKIPLVVGKDISTGKSLLTTKGLAVSVTFREDGASKPNQILSQNPAPGKEVLKNSIVTLVVTKASGMVTIPDFKGKRLRSKKKMAEELKKLKLDLGKVNYTDISDRSNGYIYSTKPKKGEKVAPGTKINFTVQYADDDE